MCKERGDKPSLSQKRYAIIINYARYMYVITLTQPYTISFPLQLLDVLALVYLISTLVL